MHTLQYALFLPKKVELYFLICFILVNCTQALHMNVFDELFCTEAVTADHKDITIRVGYKLVPRLNHQGNQLNITSNFYIKAHQSYWF